MTATAAQAERIKPGSSGYAPANGISVYYKVYGEEKPIVLLHGAYFTIEMNGAQLIPKLSKTRKVIALEFQGHGLAPFSERKLSRATLASNVVQVMDYLAIETVFIKPPAKRNVARIVEFADVSFNTEYETIKMLSDEVVKQEKDHKIVVMPELGELRESVMREQFVDIYSKVFKLPNIQINLSALPYKAPWEHIIGVALLAAVGFTMSLFLNGLAFDVLQKVTEAQYGILLALLVPGVLGITFLKSITKASKAIIPKSVLL